MKRSRWWPTPAGAALLAAVLALAACSTEAASSTASSVAPSRAPTTTSGPPRVEDAPELPVGGRIPTRRDPLRVLLAGDSVMSQLAPAVIAAVNDGGAGDARFVLTPSVARDAAIEALWRQQLEDFDPDAIAVLIGVWENSDAGAAPTAAWRRSYRRDVLEPFIDLLSSEGARIVWVGMAGVDDYAYSLQFDSINEVAQAVADQRDDVTYVAGDEVLSSPAGGYTDRLPGPDGELVRTRRVDGLHLCPDGAARLAEPVLLTFIDEWNLPVAEGWASGAWRRPPFFTDPEECPPV